MSEDRSARIEIKIDRMNEALTEIREVLAAEKQAKRAMDARVKSLEEDIKPIRRHVSVVHGIALATTFAGGLKGIAALLELFQR